MTSTDNTKAEQVCPNDDVARLTMGSPLCSFCVVDGDREVGLLHGFLLGVKANAKAVGLCEAHRIRLSYFFDLEKRIAEAMADGKVGVYTDTPKTSADYRRAIEAKLREWAADGRTIAQIVNEDYGPPERISLAAPRTAAEKALGDLIDLVEEDEDDTPPTGGDAQGGDAMRAAGEKPDAVGRASGRAANRPGDKHHEGAGPSTPAASPGSSAALEELSWIVSYLAHYDQDANHAWMVRRIRAIQAGKDPSSVVGWVETDGVRQPRAQPDARRTCIVCGATRELLDTRPLCRDGAKCQGRDSRQWSEGMWRKESDGRPISFCEAEECDQRPTDDSPMCPTHAQPRVVVTGELQVHEYVAEEPVPGLTKGGSQ